MEIEQDGMNPFIYGTGNPAKLTSMRDMLQGLPVTIIGLRDLTISFPDVDETGNDPLENARIKAEAYHAMCGLAVFSCDSGLYIDGLEDARQPGVKVRTVDGRRLDDGQMLAHYGALARELGGRAIARYRNAICLIDERGRRYEAYDDSIWSELFGLCTEPHRDSVEGFPLDALSIELTTGKYYYDLKGFDWLANQSAEAAGFRAFFQRVLQGQGE